MKAKQSITRLAHQWSHRLLTQLDRDPRSPSYGCGDRNWWHYKIRDFPSIILQQAGYAAWCLADVKDDPLERSGLRAVAAGSGLFWSRHVHRKKSFDEYYPWEQGYPPAAFSSLAVMRLVTEGALPVESVRPGIAMAVRQLASRFEAQAANQQIAGMAALVGWRRLTPDLCAGRAIDEIVDRSMALQTDEGWFWEYGGPDIGYLSVTIDCLWDAYDATGDERFIVAAEKAMGYIDEITYPWPASIGMHNARNTDYIVPYGLCRFIGSEPSPARDRAMRLVERLFASCLEPAHFFAAVDDRYVAHYIGLSVIRAARHLGSVDVGDDGRMPGHAPSRPVEMIFKESGHVRRPNGLLSLKKGGILTLRTQADAYCSDYGWSVRLGKRQYVTHWWSDAWQSRATDDGWEVSGDWVPCAYVQSSPFGHMALRLAALLFGRRLIGRLKRVLIFRPHRSALGFRRRIRWQDQQVCLEDEISGLPDGTALQRAPRASCRHVASADSGHAEDLCLASFAFSVAEERSTSEGRIQIKTTITWTDTASGERQ